MAERQADQFDASGLLGLAEAELLAPLDAAARSEIEAAARQVATVTAVVPIALADVVAALTANLRMIRRIAEIYGGRAGTLGSWRLTRAVLTHLVATGAVAIGDDMIGSLAGGGMLSKLSRRFGEGVVNGALTARVGLAAMEVCRPLPFIRLARPSVTGVVRNALTGLFAQAAQAGQGAKPSTGD
jgi:putative membrane protein